MPFITINRCNQQTVGGLLKTQIKSSTSLEAIIISNLNQLILAAPEHAFICKVTSPPVAKVSTCSRCQKPSKSPFWLVSTSHELRVSIITARKAPLLSFSYFLSYRLLFSFRQQTSFADGYLHTGIMSQHLFASEIHRIACLQLPLMREIVMTLYQKTYIMMLFVNGLLYVPQPF